MWRWQTLNPRGYQDDCVHADPAAANGTAPAKPLSAANGAANGTANGTAEVTNGSTAH